jgi:hypothetical protein
MKQMKRTRWTMERHFFMSLSAGAADHDSLLFYHLPNRKHIVKVFLACCLINSLDSDVGLSGILLVTAL